VVRDLNVTVVPGNDGWVHVTEEFTYDFDDTRGFFIEREIPVLRSVDGRRSTQTLTALSVTDDRGGPRPYQVENSRGAARIFIGDESIRLTGQHAVRITYDLSGVVRFTGHGEDFYFDAIGHGWRVPIEGVRVRLALDDETPEGIMCERYLGPNVVGDCGPMSGESPVDVRVAELRPSEMLRISFRARHGTFRRSIAPLRLMKSAATKLGLWALLPLSVLFLICVLALRATSDDSEVEAHHELPKHLGPAEVAAVLSARVDAMAFLATVVDLARRAHLSIRRVRSQRGVFALTSDDWELTHAPHGDALRDYEVVVLTALLGGEGQGLLSDSRKSIAPHFLEFRYHVYRTLHGHGRTFHTDPEKLNQRLRRVVAGSALIGGGGLLFGLTSFGFAWLSTALLVRFASRLIPLRTERGLKIQAEVAAFRIFATSATKADLIEHGAWNVRAFESLLPYAIAIGEADAWLGRYDDPYAAEEAEWMPDASDPLDELGDFLMMLRATLVGLPVREGGGMVVYGGRYSEGPFG
jgi:hypothetical protein